VSGCLIPKPTSALAGKRSQDTLGGDRLSMNAARKLRPYDSSLRTSGREGGLAPLVECHSISGGKPPFLTLSLLI